MRQVGKPSSYELNDIEPYSQRVGQGYWVDADMKDVYVINATKTVAHMVDDEMGFVWAVLHDTIRAIRYERKYE